MTIQDKVDETIEVLCDRVQKDTIENPVWTGDLTSLVSTLAELISARATLEVI